MSDRYLSPEELKDLGLDPTAIVERKPIAMPTKSADELREWAKRAEESKS